MNRKVFHNGDSESAHHQESCRQAPVSQQREGMGRQLSGWQLHAVRPTRSPFSLSFAVWLRGDQSRRQCKYYVCAWHEHLYVWIYKIIHTTHKQAYILRLAHTKCYTRSNLEILWVFVFKNILAMYDVVLISTLLKWVISEFEISLVKQGVGGDRQTETERQRLRLFLRATAAQTSGIPTLHPSRVLSFSILSRAHGLSVSDKQGFLKCPFTDESRLPSLQCVFTLWSSRFHDDAYRGI